MCGRIRLRRTEQLESRFGIDEFYDVHMPPPRFNIAPSQPVLTVTREAGKRQARLMRWGFQPAWMTHGKQPPPINARAEGLWESRMFMPSARRYRCLIPADGFYEWKAGLSGKQPYAIQLADDEPFAMAGIWTLDADGIPTCAIITTAPNELMATIHNRMPVILAPEHEAVWLDPEVAKPAEILACLRPYPAEQMIAYPISRLVNTPRNNGPELLEPILTPDQLQFG